MRWRLRFSAQTLLLQLALVGLVVAVGFVLFGAQLADQRTAEYGERALTVARITAVDPTVREQVAVWSRTDRAAAGTAAELAAGPIQQRAGQIRDRSGALFVVVTDDRGIRLSHPELSELGRPVSTDPSVALSGGEEIVEQTGTLGRSARAKVPIVGEDGTVLGAVSVGIATEVIDRAWRTDLAAAAAFAGGSLILGTVGTVLLAGRFRRLTLGLEPAEMTALIAEHEAVLGGVSEAVVAVDPHGRITVANDEARRLLGEAVVPGRLLAEAGLPPTFTELIDELLGRTAPVEQVRTGPHHLVVNDRILLWVGRGVRRANRSLGVVISARDRTDLESLTRELDVTRTVSTALRAQRHEFANRLHVVHGLVAAGNTEPAVDYLRQVLGAGPLGTVLSDLDTVCDPTLQAFLSAKAAQFRERSVLLRIGAATWLPTAVADPVPVTVVLGNLLDNAAEAAAESDPEASEDRWVEVDIMVADNVLHLTVTDSGGGVPATVRDNVFQPGVSTSRGAGRGLGLALARQVAGARGGQVRLADPGGGGRGAVFHATLPLDAGVLVVEQPR